MPNRENVIKWLAEISLRPCDFTTEDFDATQTEHLADDALDLLREQEPVTPVCTEYDKAIVLFSCRDCKTQLLFGQRYCHMCGRAVKWGA